MRLFLDTNVLLAACGRPTGASRAIFDRAVINGWILLASRYVLTEVARNLPQLPPSAAAAWRQLSPALRTVRDVWTIDRPAVFGPAKDRPVLFTATAWAEVLLTLDRGDFGNLMGTGFYGLDVMTPGDFLQRERAAGRLR